ncbi:MAG: 8-amino-7-oxononanoate synthase [Pseudomonadota bacterium]
MDWRARIAESNAARDAAARRRLRRTVGRRQGTRCEVGGRALLNFCSNDYLGLSQHPEVIAALRDAAADGVGSTASHLVCGHHALHDALEREVADWLQLPRALLFSSGFVANLAVLQALLRRGDLCLQDRLNHASLIDAARLADATLRRYPHGDAGAAGRHVDAAAGRPVLIATDGVFSMDGDVAPLRELAAVARGHDALLYVDDAHGVGVHGPAGRGSVAAAGLTVREVPLQLATLGKALGTYGALVAGEADLVQYLSETARGYVYTTALPPALAAAGLAAVRLARRADDRRAHLQSLVARLRERAVRHGLDLLPSETPIQAVMAHDDRRALAMSRSLEDAGFWVSAIRPPTVPEGRARLRVTLTALHSPDEVDALADALARARDATSQAPEAPA